MKCPKCGRYVYIDIIEHFRADCHPPGKEELKDIRATIICGQCSKRKTKYTCDKCKGSAPLEYPLQLNLWS